jgi:hypothetical protein
MGSSTLRDILAAPTPPCGSCVTRRGALPCLFVHYAGILLTAAAPGLRDVQQPDER